MHGFQHCLILLTGLMTVLGAGSAAGETVGQRIIGPAEVIDARTIAIGGRQVVLWKIDAPSPQQKCLRQDVAWDCGRIAHAQMRDIVRGGELDCLIKNDASASSPPVARCYLGYSDIAAALIDRGYAIAIDVRTSPYRQNHREARGANRGLFSGVFMPPERWRQGERLPGL